MEIKFSRKAMQKKKDDVNELQTMMMMMMMKVSMTRSCTERKDKTVQLTPQSAVVGD